MKKIFLSLALFLLFSSNAHATTWYACSGGGNWSASVWTSIIGDIVGCIGATGTPVAGDTAILNSNSGNITITSAAAAASIDETGYTGTLAFGTQTLTLTAASNLTGAMTNTSGTISTSGNITLLATPTGTCPTIKPTGAITLTSGGFTWPGAMNFNVVGNVTLSGNWITTGLTTFTSATNVNLTTAETYTANGGLTMTSATGTTPTATIVLGGGTWQTNNKLWNNLTLAGSSTVSSSVNFGGTTLTYSSGTITTTGSTLTISGATPTINTNGMTWATITMPTTVALGSDLQATTISNNGNGATWAFTGAHDVTTGTLKLSCFSSVCSFTFPASRTLNVTSVLTLQEAIGATSFTVLSGTSSTAFNLNFSGAFSSENVVGIVFTDVTASGKAIYNYFGSTLTRVTSITNKTAADIGGAGGQGYIY